jgi:hypothetical protein
LKSFFFAAALHYINIKTIHKVTKRQEKKSNFGMKKLIFLIKDYQGIEFHAHFKDIFTGFRAFFISLKGIINYTKAGIIYSQYLVKLY